MTSIQFLVEWAIRSSVLILTGALLLWVLRVKSPSIRLAVWTALLCASLALPVLTGVLPRLPLVLKQAAPARVEAPISIDESGPAQTPATLQRETAAKPRSRFDWARAALISYIVIALILLLRLSVGLALSLRLLRNSSATDIGVRESDSVAAPVTLGIVRPEIVLPTDWRKWDATKLDAVLAHERSHILRRDPAVQLLSAIHRALLWHSPLSWFLHRRMLRTAEEASDDAAVFVTHDRALYAEVLLDFMQRGVRRASWIGVPMARYGNVEARIHRILDGTTLSRRVSRWSIAAIVVLGAPVAYVVSAAQPQGPTIVAQKPAAVPRFEVASVKPCNGDERVPEGGGGRGESGGGPASSPGRLRTACMPLRFFIETAYIHFADTRFDRTRDLRLVGGPAWIDSAEYQIEAKAPDNTSQSMMRGPMLQGLLEDRFQLRIHREARKIPVYELVVARQGFNLSPTDGRSCTARDPTQFPPPPFDPSQKQACGIIKLLAGPHKVIFDLPGATVTEFSKYLPDAAGRAVVDKTGITGLFDFHMEFARGTVQSLEPSPDNDVQSVFSALAQIGLRLQPAKGSKEFLVIDTVARASEN